MFLTCVWRGPHCDCCIQVVSAEAAWTSLPQHGASSAPGLSLTASQATWHLWVHVTVPAYEANDPEASTGRGQRSEGALTLSTRITGEGTGAFEPGRGRLGMTTLTVVVLLRKAARGGRRELTCGRTGSNEVPWMKTGE